MEWGTYKPNQFFGIKNRDPSPVTVGMLWAVPDQMRRGMDVRHTYKYQSGDGIIAYFEYHDGWSTARQIIEDPNNNARIEVDWLKTVNIDDDNNKELQQQWKALITVKPINDKKIVAINPFFYLSYSGGGLQLQQISNPNNPNETKILKVTRNLRNKKGEVEFFEFRNVGNDTEGFTVMGLNIQDEQLWNVEDIYKRNLRDFLMAGQSNENNANFISLRIPQPMPKEFKFIISYQKKSYLSQQESSNDSILMKSNVDQLLEDFETQKKFRLKTFDFKLSSVFNLTQSRFDTDPILNDFKDKGLAFSREALSNTLGNIGYYYGSVLIKKKGGQGASYDEPAPLFTGSPSRNRFPRGFLWDEGFHLMVTCQWSKLICMDILGHWFNTMKPTGWIAREQIRGAEAESAVPREFIVQDPQVANPPSMMFPMKYLIDQANHGDQKMIDFLKGLYGRWQKWYEWFFKSQENPSIPNTFSWRGRTAMENLPSGLDDYPRAYIVNEGYEIHLDLQSWMVEFSKFMSNYAQLIGDQSQSSKYLDKSIKIEEELHDKLYNKNMNLYCDYVGLQFQPKLDANGKYAEPIEWRTDHKCGVNAKNSLKQPAKCNHPYGQDEYLNVARCCRNSDCVPDPECNCPNCEYHTSIDDDYNTQLMNQFSLHQGIINFFPIMFGLIKDKNELDSSLRVLADQNKMLGKSGLRSLSKEDQFFLHGSNYWRGAVWINVNYLVLKGLFQNYKSMVPFMEEQAQLKGNYEQTVQTSDDLYQLIRQRLIRSVYMNWRINHLFWEQYDQESGLGLFTNPFTGWTSLILLITSEKYI